MRELSPVILLSFPIGIRGTKAVSRRYGAILATLGLELLSIVSSLCVSLGTKCQVYSWRCGKAECQTDCLQVQLVHIENVSQRMTGIGQKIASVRITRRLVQIVVLFN